MKVKRVKYFFTLVMVLSLTYISVPSPAQEKQTSETKVAVINGSVITKGDFDRELKNAQRNLPKTGQPVDENQQQAFEKDVLERLITVELLYQESQKNGIKVEETAINERVKSIKESIKKSIKKQAPDDREYKKMLQSMNISETNLKSIFKRDLAIRQFVDKKFADKITVSDEEAKSYYDSHPEFFIKPAQIKASHILVKANPQADETAKAAARKKIEEIQQKLKNGEDFATLAKEFSECSTQSSGGDLGYFGHGKMVKPFEDAAFALAPGETSGIVETQYGYHIIKCIDKKSETTFDYEEIKEKLLEYLKQKRVQEQVTVYVEELKKKAKIERFLPVNL